MKKTGINLAIAVGAFGILGGYFAVAQDSNPLGASGNTPTSNLFAQSGTSPPVDVNVKADAIAQDQSFDLQSRDILSKYRKATTSSERDGLSSDVEKIVAAQFDVRQRLREQELQQLADQLSRLRNIHQQRAEQKDRIVKDRVQQLLRDADGLGWGDAPSGPWPGVGVQMHMDGMPFGEHPAEQAQRDFEQSVRDRVQRDLTAPR